MKPEDIRTDIDNRSLFVRCRAQIAFSAS